jgi:hypothetical protein
MKVIIAEDGEQLLFIATENRMRKKNGIKMDLEEFKLPENLT